MSRTHVVTSLPFVLAAAALLVGGCDKDKPASTTTSASSSSASAAPSATVATSASVSGTASAGSFAVAAPKSGAAVTFGKELGLSTPESVFYDEASDVYLVSNINGEPGEADGNGFIAKLTPDGKLDTLKWIEGGKNKVTLNAPKGMTVANDMLYVADLDTVRVFDRKTGAPAFDVKIPGATFLNDMTTAADGRVLVSDTGMKAVARGLEPSGTDAVYAIDKTKKVTTVAKSKDLGGPNGLLAIGDKVWVVTSTELYSLDAKGKKSEVTKPPKGNLDGIVALPNGDILVSSWDASTVYRGKPGGELVPLVTDVTSCADIGYDKKRNRVLIPLFTENEVRAYAIK